MSVTLKEYMGIFNCKVKKLQKQINTLKTDKDSYLDNVVLGPENIDSNGSYNLKSIDTNEINALDKNEPIYINGDVVLSEPVQIKEGHPLHGQTLVPHKSIIETNSRVAVNAQSIDDEITRSKNMDDTLDTRLTTVSMKASANTSQHVLNTTMIQKLIGNTDPVALDSFTEAIADETTRATAAELVNSTAIADETTRATAAEGANSTAITDVDEVNSTAIADETTRATAAEGVNSTAIADETTRATAAEVVNSTAIADETTRATAAEVVNSTAIADETTRATGVEVVNSTAIADETTRATAAEGFNSTAIADETTRATGVEVVNSTAIADETTRATAAEVVNSTAIADETTRATGVEVVNSTAIADETTRATASEGLIQGQISSIMSNVDPIALDSFTEAVLKFQDLYTSAGLESSGEYVADATTNYLTDAASFKHADNNLDIAIAAEVSRAQAAELVNSTAIADETTRATAAEVVNSTAIADETTRATGVEVVNSTAIADETTRATAAEVVNSTAIADETTRAQGVEATNSSAIAVETTRAAGVEATNSSAIADETTRAQGVEATNSSAIAVETTRAAGVEATNSSAIADETTRATGVEATNSSAIAVETTRAAGVEATNSSAIADETTRATGVEATNSSAIAVETTRAAGVEAVNSTAIAYETTRATTAEGLIQGQISSNNGDGTANSSAIADETTRATGVEATNSSAIAVETTRAAGVEATNSSAIADETTRATGIEATNSSAIAVETTRAAGVEATNSSAIADETTRATGVEATNSSAIAVETTRAAGVEATNSSAIADETTRATGVEATNSSAIAVETTRAAGVEATNSSAIADETTRATGVEATNSSAIAVETTRAAGVEATNSSAIADETTRATGVEATNSSAIAVETTRAAGVEATNSSAIADETTRAAAAEVVNSTAIDRLFGEATVTITGTETQGLTLTASISMDGLLSLPYNGTPTYQWKRDSVDIGGAISSTYILVQADVDALISVTATYLWVFGTNKNATSLETGAIGNVNDAPTITSAAVTTATEDSLYTYTVTTNDEDGDIVTLVGTTVPAWLTFVPSTGVLSGTPLEANVGTNLVTITASDGNVNVTHSFTITVAHVNDAPTITSAAVTTATEDSLYTYTVTTNDEDGDIVTLVGTTVPAWLTFVPSTGVLSGTPLQANVGTNPVTITASDGNVNVTHSFTITVANVNDAPTITSAAVTAATEDSLYTYTVTTNDEDGDIVTLVGTTVPAWLTFVPSTGVLSGTPLQANVGTHPVTITASDGNVNVTHSFTITVANVNDAPTITSAAVTTATEDSLYTYTVTTNDEDGDIVTLVGTTVPAWLTFVPSTGVLSGTPLQANVGTNPVTITASDGTLSVGHSFTITVAHVNDAPTITSAAVTTATEDSLYTYTVTTNDEDGETVTLVGTTVPAWLTFVPSTGVLSGTPLQANVGTNPVTITASDGNVNVTHSFTITVANVNDAPTITSAAVTAATEDSLYTYTVTTNDEDGDIVTLVGTTVPAWLTFVPSTGVLSGTPLQANVGTHPVTITASDGTLSVGHSFNIVVVNVNDAPSGSLIINGTAIEDQTLNAYHNITDEDGDMAPVEYQWNTRDTAGGIDTAISGETNTSLTLGQPQVGKFITVTILYTDGHGTAESVTSAAIGAVANVNDAPTITSAAVTTATEDSLYTYTVTTNDEDGDIVTLVGTTVPAWLTFVPSTGVLSGTPLQANVGTNPVTITASDGNVNVTHSFIITVTNVNDAPTITSAAVTTATEDSLYTYTVTTNDEDGDIVTLVGTTVPAWLTFVPSTGVLSGTPLQANVGTHPVTITASDGTLSVGHSFNITVAHVNDAPTITSAAVTTATEDSLYTYTVTTNDEDGETVTLVGTTVPAWLTFVPSTGVLSGTPLQANVGTNPVTITASDGTLSVGHSFTITVANVNDAPTITSAAVTTATEDSLYTYTVTTNDEDGDIVTLVGTTVPAWLTFVPSTGVLSGTPLLANVGTHPVTITASDGTLSVGHSFTITVANVNDAPTITSAAVTTATEDSLYTYTVTTNDEDGDIVTLEGTTVPAWLTFVPSTGVLSGTPLQANVGINPVIITASDGNVNVTHFFTITVTNVNDAPTITSAAVTTATEDSLYTYTVTTNDEDGDIVTLVGTTVPAWLTFVPSTGVLSGTPLQANVGTNPVTITASDGNVNVTHSFTITVANVNDAPTITSAAVTTATEDSLYTYTVTTNDEDGEIVTLVGTTVPAWLTFVPSTGVLSGTPLQANVGTHPVTITASDGTLSVGHSFNIVVVNVNDAPSGYLIINGTAKVGQTLDVFNNITDEDLEGPLSYQWNTRDTSGGTDTAISGAIDGSFVLTNNQQHKYISVTASYIDGQGTAESVTSAEIGPVVA